MQQVSLRQDSCLWARMAGMMLQGASARCHWSGQLYLMHEPDEEPEGWGSWGASDGEVDSGDDEAGVC